MMLVYFLLLVGFSILLIKATEIVTDSLQELAEITKVGKFAITSLLLAFATSVPELVVGVTAALEGRPNLALGAVLGSNIADISLVIGGAALIGGSFSVAGEFLKMDIFSVFLAGVMPLMLLMDSQLSRVDGIILLFIYGMYNFGLLRKRVDRSTGGHGGLLRRMLMVGTRKKLNRWLAWLFLGAAMLVFSADMIVKSGIILAKGLNLPVFMIGLFLVGVGTSLPELSFEIRAVRKKQIGMALGDLFGSVVANSTLILGIVSLIAPIKLTNGLNAYLLAAAAFGVMFLLFWQFVRTKKKLERWEGLVLILVYLGFVMMEWMKR
ncbi:MAG: sodium:calcium antiporter [Patescibacteria group bacterium]|nr:sodium:calcium antiporter [Patescibacteria group bacterium]